MKYLFLTINWTFGMMFLLAGSTALILASSVATALTLILISLLLLPPVRNFVHSKTNKILTTGDRAICIIALLVLGMIFAPGPDDYLPIANMTKVQSHYEEAIRLARSTYVKGIAQEGQGLANTVPTDTSGWILLFNPGGNLAPGGGNAYLADDVDGDVITGAIGVVSISEQSVLIAKPAYNELSAETTTVNAASASKPFRRRE